jgi:ubiquitin carboxyl-terminal hydrolase 7
LDDGPSIQVARDEDLAFQIGKEIHFDLVDHDKVRSFRIQRQTLFSQFKVRKWLMSGDHQL